MSNPFILICRVRVKEGKVDEYLKLAKKDTTPKIMYTMNCEITK